MKQLLTILFLFLPFIVSAQEKTFEREYTYKASEMDSKASCRAIAINQLRSMLLNELGVYVQSESILKTSEVSGKFSQDFAENIATISAGITKLEVLNETWNGETFWMKASITIDKKDLEKSLKQVANDRQKIKEMEDLKLQLNEATNELEKMQKEHSNENRQKPLSASLEDQFDKAYDSVINKIVSTYWFLSAKEKGKRSDNLGASSDFSKAIELSPDYYFAYLGRGTSKYELKDYEGAIEDYSKAIELNPKGAMSYSLRGASKSHLNDISGAIEDFKKSIELDPNFSSAYGLLGIMKVELRDYNGAMSDLSKDIELNPKAANSYNVRGNLKTILNDTPGALNDFSKAIKIDPEMAEIYINRGYLMNTLKNYSAALNDYTKAIQLDPQNSLAYANRGGVKFFGFADYTTQLQKKSSSRSR